MDSRASPYEISFNTQYAICLFSHVILANVNCNAVARPSVCLSSVTLVHPAQAVIICDNFSAAFRTLAIR